MSKKKATKESQETNWDTIEQLKQDLQMLSFQKRKIQEAEKEIHEKIAKRYSKPFMDELKARGKEYGDVTMEIDGIKTTMQIKKTVDWDSDKLFLVARDMGPAKATEIMTIECKMPEANFNKIEANNPFYKRIIEARTVKYSAPKFSFPETE